VALGYGDTDQLAVDGNGGYGEGVEGHVLARLAVFLL